MNGLIFAIQVFSVGSFFILGTIWTVTNAMFAWSFKADRTNGEIIKNGMFGMLLLAVAAGLSYWFGWIS